MDLFPHQERALSWLPTIPKGFLALEQGLGKTAVAILEARYPTLIVVPGYLIPNWVREIQMWRPETRICVDGDRDVREYDVFIQSYDTTHRRPPDPRRFRSAIFDESQYTKNPKAKRTLACMELIHRIPRVRLLSGTPFFGRPIELWAVCYAMGITRLDYNSWGFYYCGGFVDRFGKLNFRGVTKKHLPELKELVGPKMFRLTKEEAMKLPPKMRRLIVVNAPLDRRERTYDIDQIRDAGSPVPFVGLAEVMKHHGLGKIDAAVEHTLSVLDSEQKVLVFAHHTEVVAGIVEKLQKAGIEVGSITGASSNTQRDRLRGSFQDGTLRVLVGNIQAMGTGLTLTAARYVIFVEASWNKAVNDQAEDRVHRIGQGLPVQIDYLVVDGSIDSKLVEVALNKSEVSAEVLGDNDRRVHMSEKSVAFKDDGESLIEAGKALGVAIGHVLVLFFALMIRFVKANEGKSTVREDAVIVATAAETAETAKKPGRPSAASKAAAAAAAAVDPAAPEPVMIATTIEQVKDVLRKVQEIDKGRVKSILNELGASNMDTLTKANYHKAVIMGNAFLALHKPKAEPVDDLGL